jgi:hypothetical protein
VGANTDAEPTVRSASAEEAAEVAVDHRRCRSRSVHCRGNRRCELAQANVSHSCVADAHHRGIGARRRLLHYRCLRHDATDNHRVTYDDYGTAAPDNRAHDTVANDNRAHDTEYTCDSAAATPASRPACTIRGGGANPPTARTGASREPMRSAAEPVRLQLLWSRSQRQQPSW